MKHFHLIKVFCLDPAPGLAKTARFFTRLLEKQLIYNDVVGVNATLSQLLHQSFSLVKGQELCDANAHEGRCVWVAKLFIDLFQTFYYND